MKYLVLLMIVAFAPCGFALDKDELEALAKKPHQEGGLMEELKIFPKVKEYSITVIQRKPGEESVTLAEDVKGTEKWVDGKYVVSVIEFPNGDSMIFAKTYDKKATVYRKWVLIPTGEVAHSVGTAVGESRAISWIGLTEVGGDGTLALSQDVNTDDSVTWREVIMKDGEVVNVMEGTAKKVK